MMDRREFADRMAGMLAAAALSPAPLSTAPHPERSAGSFVASLLRMTGSRAAAINAARLNAHLKELSAFGANPQGGVSRVAYSDADRAGREYVMALMRAASLDVSVDSAANIWGRRAGTDRSAKPIVFGSHIDSVPEGGNYDGALGSIAAIEVAQTLAENNIKTRHPLDVVIWSNEEGGLYGSMAVSGQLGPSDLGKRAWSGKTIAEGIAFLGGAPERIGEVRRAPGSIATYLELHVEQGGTLERDSVNIGVVEGIVGIRQWDLTVTGVQNHAGTTPMDQRHDALLSAARFVDAVNRVVRAEPGRQVGTVGRIQAYPGAVNVIPGRVACSLELRDLDASKIDALFERIRMEARRIGGTDGTAFDFRPLHENVPARTDPVIRSLVEQAAKTLGYSTRHLPSGAGHDAQSMAQLGPMGMIFIPSIAGISHSPKEYSTPEDCARGASVLLGAVLLADGADAR